MDSVEDDTNGAGLFVSLYKRHPAWRFEDNREKVGVTDAFNLSLSHALYE